MSTIYNELNRKSVEKLDAYDNRINGYDPLLVGYAYFGPCGYHGQSSSYGLYIVWNGEINSLLKAPHPECGYAIECDKDSAIRFYTNMQGVGVYGKLQSIAGKVTIPYMYLADADSTYQVSYIGMSVARPDGICFQNMTDNKPADIFESNSEAGCEASGSFNLGSFNLGSFNVGSFSLSSFNLGSFNLSSFNLGSFNLSSFNLGSFNLSSFNLGSFNIGSFSLSSFNMSSFNLSSFSLGSFNLGSFNLGSFNLGSFNLGSFNLSSFNLGSFNLGSFDLGSFSLGDFKYAVDSSTSFYASTLPFKTSLKPEEFSMPSFYKDVYGIGYLGYGLNLI